MDALYRFRDGFAAGPSLLLLAGLQVFVMRPAHGPEAPISDPVEIMMIAPPPEPEPEPEPPPPPPPTRPIAPQAPAARPAPAVSIPVTPSPEVATPESIPLPVPPVAQPTPAPTPMIEPPLVQVRPPAPKPGAELEAIYVAKVRQMLNAIKRYPTGREASLLRPSGVVRVWLIIDRQGRLLDRGIETSSQSLLLDNAALRTVAMGNYPVFSDELWAGQAQHRFHVDIDFVLSNS